MIQTLLITFIVFIVAVAMMAVGVMISGKRLRGSCGGTPTFGPDGEPLTCDTCPNKDKKENAAACDHQDAAPCPHRNAAAH